MIMIKCLKGFEFLDSRGTPTVGAEIELSDGTKALALSPSGASTGEYEAYELRDNDQKRFGGKGVLKAVDNINTEIATALYNLKDPTQDTVDKTMIELDSTDNKSRLGANAILAVSMAFAAAVSKSKKIPIYRSLLSNDSYTLPVPMMNILNGGAHSKNNVDIQEFMIVPVGAKSFIQAMEFGTAVYRNLGEMLTKKGLHVGVGDEGGFAPDLQSDEEGIELIVKAIENAGLLDKVKIALDVAASEWYLKGKYFLPKRKQNLDSDSLITKLEKLVNNYPIISIEDGLSENDWDGWQSLTGLMGNRIMLVGDDLFVTNVERLQQGINRKCANSILIKPNQIGTVSETLKVISSAKRNGYKVVISHRSGETEDSFIADLAVASSADFIKSGAPCRTDRTVKYNRLLKIAYELCNE
ncbi:MAG: phosphopyruvate hydratase [bacterium]|nr:phosphopyruvate hydratase [bacterium]